MPARALISVALVGTIGLSASALAYPGGTPTYVTDVAPFCTGCHSSTTGDQLQGAPPQRVQAELAVSKHLAKIRAAKEGSPYAKLSAEQRGALIAGIERIDAAARVELQVPESVPAGEEFEITLRATGGGGPVVGLALVDSDQRWQARPAPAAGWQIVEKPVVTGPDGEPQTRFTDGRNPELAPGTSYVNVYGVSASPTDGTYSTVSVTFKVRAPGEPGSYPVAGVFLYGTEKGSPNGAVETVMGKLPVGGYTANSGRVTFTPVRQIQVQ